MLGGNLAPLEFKATLLEQGWFLEEAPFDLVDPCPSAALSC